MTTPALLEAFRELVAAPTPTAAAEATVEAADRALEAAAVEVAIADGSALAVVADAGAPAASPRAPRAYDIVTSLPGAAYTAGKACVVNDRLDTRSAAASAGGCCSG
jgi:hypothetical protein